MYAVIKTGGKQYKVAADDVLKIEKLEAEVGSTVTFDEVLLVNQDGKTTIGAPLVKGASVAAELVEQMRAKKLIVFKKKRRHNYRRKKGHRQELSLVRITSILTGGAKPKKAAAKQAPPKKNDESKADRRVEKAKIVDDIKHIGGVGPALEKKLNEAGITSLKQIAEFKEEDLVRMDEELKLRGRIETDGWIDQAKELLAGKSPRVKTDEKAAKAAKKD